MIPEIAEALELPDRESVMYAYAKRRREAGEPWDVVYADFLAAYTELDHDEEAQEAVACVADCLWGYCNPAHSLRY